MEQMFRHEPFWLECTGAIQNMNGRKMTIVTAHGIRISTLLRVIEASPEEQHRGDCKILAVRCNEDGTTASKGRYPLVRAPKWSRYLGMEAMRVLFKAAPAGPEAELLLHVPERDTSVPLDNA